MSEKTTQTKICVCVGSGGVGKTTVAAALGLAAARAGKKVLVLTIDPSRRLAQTLGIEGKTEITRVESLNVEGELWASVINHKRIFDDFVRRAAQKSEAVDRILKNKLYQQLSTTLSGSQEFTSLEMLYSCFESGKFDLIILDTPPAQHALEFLQAPQKFSALFSETITKWFRTSKNSEGGFLKNLFQSGTQQVLKILETLTGSEFVHQLRDFFQSIEQWQGALDQRVQKVHEMLISPSTEFTLVTSFDGAKLNEAQFFIEEIKKHGYHLTSVLLNRAFPDWIIPQGHEASKETQAQEIFRLGQVLMRYYQQRLELYREFEGKLGTGVEVIKLPEFSEPISDLDGLTHLSDDLKEFAAGKNSR